MTDTLPTESILSPIDLFGTPPAADDDAEPRRPAGRRSTEQPKTRARRTAWAAAPDVEKALVESIQFLAGGAMLLPALEPDAALVYEHGERIIHEVVELGKTDKRLRVFLERLAAPGKYGPLVVACFPLVLGIAANHNLIPGFLNASARHSAGGE